MERIFIVNLKKQLKERIKACSISVHIINDILIIDIRSIGLDLWRYTINDISEQFLIGLSSRIVANIIFKQYKKYILSQYFYKD